MWVPYASCSRVWRNRAVLLRRRRAPLRRQRSRRALLCAYGMCAKIDIAAIRRPDARCCLRGNASVAAYHKRGSRVSVACPKRSMSFPPAML